MILDLRRVTFHARASVIFVGALDRAQKRLKWNFRIHDDRPLTRQPDEKIRTKSAILSLYARLFVEVAMVEHAR